MRIGIRVDANEIIATGHAMRCLAIAAELRKAGENPVFISADSFPRTLIEREGFEFVSLRSDWSDMDGETGILREIIAQYQIGVLLVDSYYVTKAYFGEIHAFTKTAYIDDLGKCVYDVDAVICYVNYYKELALEKRYPKDMQLLLGPEYAPLRNVFSNLPPKEVASDIKRLLVLSGGTDPYDFLWDFSKKVAENHICKMLEEVSVICGRYYDRFDELEGKFAGNPKFHFYKAVRNMESYMSAADVAVSAAGVTTYELCAVGTPTITYTFADNQKENAKFFYKEGIMEYAGDLRYDQVLNNIIGFLDGEYRDFSYRKKRMEMMRQKVDGKGAARVAGNLRQMLNQNARKE